MMSYLVLLQSHSHGALQLMPAVLMQYILVHHIPVMVLSIISNILEDMQRLTYTHQLQLLCLQQTMTGQPCIRPCDVTCIFVISGMSFLSPRLRKELFLSIIFYRVCHVDACSSMQMHKEAAVRHQLGTAMLFQTSVNAMAMLITLC